jgi:hypothetical protein
MSGKDLDRLALALAIELEVGVVGEILALISAHSRSLRNPVFRLSIHSLGRMPGGSTYHPCHGRLEWRGKEKIPWLARRAFALYSGASARIRGGRPGPSRGDQRHVLRARQKLGKYRIERRLSDGPLAAVYQAFDTIHGLRVALKIPHRRMMDDYFLADFRKEVRVLAKLEPPEHPADPECLLHRRLLRRSPCRSA